MPMPLEIAGRVMYPGLLTKLAVTISRAGFPSISGVTLEHVRSQELRVQQRVQTRLERLTTWPNSHISSVSETVAFGVWQSQLNPRLARLP